VAAVNCEHENDTTRALSSDNVDLIKYYLNVVQVLTSNFERVTRELEERNETFAINPVKSDERAHDSGLHPLRVAQVHENGDNKSHELLALSPRKSGGISSTSSQVGYQIKVPCHALDVNVTMSISWPHLLASADVITIHIEDNRVVFKVSQKLRFG